MAWSTVRRRRVHSLGRGDERAQRGAVFGCWAHSESDAPNGEEVHKGTCWRRCHIAAPYNGAWYDYRR